MTRLPEHEDFLKQLNSMFTIRISETENLESELVEVSELKRSARQEQFSTVFRTSNDLFLGQGMQTLEHPVLGQLELFLVPVNQDAAGTYYEAYFNRLPNEN